MSTSTMTKEEVADSRKRTLAHLESAQRTLAETNAQADATVSLDWTELEWNVTHIHSVPQFGPLNHSTVFL